MPAPCRTTFALLAVLASLPSRSGAEDLHWTDATSLAVEGRGWDKTAGPFDRLPDSAKEKVTKSVWGLSKDSAGVCVRFLTNADALSVRWSVTSDRLDMPHMPATGVSGVDLYSRENDDSWRFIGNGRPAKQDGNQARFEFPDGSRADRECLLYLPLYNGTKSLEIGVPPDAQLKPPAPRPEDHRKPVVVYGTSITQGGCASRPGMAWTSILGRFLDRPVINLGFSGSGRMEPPIGQVLAELDPAVYLIDCTWNMGYGPDVYLDRITQLVKMIRETHPATPILFLGQSHIRPDAHPTRLTRQQADVVHKLQKDGVQGLSLIPPDDLNGDDGEATVDGVHLNDLGMLRHAHTLLPYLQKALDNPAKP